MKDCYHYTECGLDNIFLVNGFERHETPYGSGVSVHDVDDLHQVIAENICSGKQAMNGKEFRFVRKMLGLSQHALGALVGANEQAVARWEKEQSKISGASERLVRIFFLERTKENALAESLLNALQEMDAEMDAQRLFQQDDQWRLAA